jgi:isocitrate/isopropylmalate dehydrogenase
MAMILAAASLLGFVDDPSAKQVSRALYEATFETVRAGTRTADLGGHAFTNEFTDAVIEAVRNKLELWSSLGMS